MSSAWFPNQQGIDALMHQSWPVKLRQTLMTQIRIILLKAAEYRHLVTQADDLELEHSMSWAFLETISDLRQSKTKLEEARAKRDNCKRELEKMIGNFE